MLKCRRCRCAAAAGALFVAGGLVAARTASAALVAYYNFDDDSNPAVVVDNSGNGHVGTPTGAATYAAGGAPIAGGGGNAFQFFGDPDSVGLDITGTAVPFSTLTANNTGTVAFWTRTGRADQTHFGLFQNGFVRQYQAHVPWSDNGVYFDAGGNSTTGQGRISAPITRTGPYDFEQWHHWAFVKNGATATIYRDGNLFLTGAQTSPIGQIDTAAIGNRIPDSNEAVTGLMDEFIVFNHPLTEAEVERLMTEGGVVFVPEPGALGLLGIGALGLLRRVRRSSGR